MISLAESAMIKFKLLRNPGAYLVDFIPLRMPTSSSMEFIPDDFASTVRYVPAWFPGAGFKKEALDVRELLEENANVPFQFSVQEMVYDDVFSTIRARGTNFSVFCTLPGKGNGTSLLNKQKHAGCIYDGS